MINNTPNPSGRPGQAHSYQLELNVPSQVAVLDACLSDAGLTSELSAPGQIAQGLLRFAEPALLPVFGNGDVIAVIGALTTPRARRIASELKDHLGEDLGDAEIVAISREFAGRMRQVERSVLGVASAAGLKQQIASRALSELIDADFVTRGFIVACSTCGQSTFEELARLSGQVYCPGCGAHAALAERGSSGEPEIHYRLSTLLDRASDQGVVAHLYAAARLAEKYESPLLLLGTNVLEKGRLLGEIDLLGVGDSDLFAGEAKSSAQSFTPEQIRRDVDLSKRVGADAHVMACPAPIDSEAIDMCQALCADAGMRAEVLTGPAS